MIWGFTTTPIVFLIGRLSVGVVVNRLVGMGLYGAQHTRTLEKMTVTRKTLFMVISIYKPKCWSKREWGHGAIPPPPPENDRRVSKTSPKLQPFCSYHGCFKLHIVDNCRP